ncbi:transposase-like protein [Bacillus atrophaeus]|nr:transposase-like protein [Bacillus atrophaeus]
MSYPVEVKQKAVEMRLAGVPVKEIMQELNIKNKTQVQTWIRWDKQDTAFVLDTLNQLPTLLEECVLQSNQGSVYASYEYQKAVKTKVITMSMSRKGTPADNASIESFHSSLKSETFYLNSIDRTTTAIAERTVKEYIHDDNKFVFKRN